MSYSSCQWRYAFTAAKELEYIVGARVQLGTRRY